MRIYPDTSFLVAWLYSQDARNHKARLWFAGHPNNDWVLSDWSRFETVNSLRNLCTRTSGPRPEVAEALRRFLNRLLIRGPFEQDRVDWQEVIREANQISAAFGSRMKARSADTLHLAIIEQIDPDLFLSGDKDQLALAAARGFNVADFS
ncbi:MAG TPA: PIN domain-containing protein [Candidatus Binatia bacterium]|nr:PIN domain-containing protein [Candidatus Binatia bacterium]